MPRGRYYKFLPYPGSYSGTEEGKGRFVIGAKLENLPLNAKGSARGRPPFPEWLENLRLAVLRDADDARTSLKEFEFSFDPSVKSNNPEKLIHPCSSGSKSVPSRNRGQRNEGLILHALQHQNFSRAQRDGGKIRKDVANVHNKTELTRKIRANVRRDAMAANPEVTDCTLARNWYSRLWHVGLMYRRGLEVFEIGRHWARQGKELSAEDMRAIIRELLDTKLTMGVDMKDLCAMTYITGVNPAELWFEFGNLYSDFEALASLGRISNNCPTELDKFLAPLLEDYFRIPLVQEEGEVNLILMRQTIKAEGFFILNDYPARASGSAEALTSTNNPNRDLWKSKPRTFSHDAISACFFPQV